MAQQKFCRLGEAARTLGVSPSTVKRWIDQGALAVAFRSPGPVGQSYIAVRDLDRLTRTHTTDAVKRK